MTCSNYWNSNSGTGNRTLNLSTASATLQGDAISQIPAGGAISRQQVVWANVSGTDFTLYAVCYQDSGSSVNVSGQWHAVRIA